MKVEDNEMMTSHSSLLSYRSNKRQAKEDYKFSSSLSFNATTNQTRKR